MPTAPPQRVHGKDGNPTDVHLTKGHGTQNDFLLLLDPEGEFAVDAELVRLLCDRRAGIGADGLIRVVRNGAMRDEAVAAPSGVWFMDYRNADGSIAEMCGNGVRVFARFLDSHGLADRSGPLEVATRSGVKSVRFEDDGQVTVGMGIAELMEGEVEVSTEAGSWTATGALLPNPHAVALVADPDAVGRLVDAPVVRPATAFPAGVNVEFVRIVEPGHLIMRVYERGVGETRSCGTGICAAAIVAARTSPGRDRWRVDVPGGTTWVRLVPGGSIELTGPAHLVGTVEVDLAALRAGAQLSTDG